MQLNPQTIAEIIIRVFYLAASAASMKAIDSNAQVKSEHIHTYNFLIFIVVILVLQILGFIATIVQS